MPSRRKRKVVIDTGVLGGCLLARVGEIKSQYAPHKVGNLFYSDTTSGINSQGAIYVDVEETWQQKIEALRAVFTRVYPSS